MTKKCLNVKKSENTERRKSSDEKNFDIQLGNRILDILKQQNHSQKWLADKLTISESKMSRMLSGRSSLSSYWLKMIAACLNVSVEFLLYGTNKHSHTAYEFTRIKKILEELLLLIEDVSKKSSLL